MNVFPVWKYTLIALICLLGSIYAAPNVFQPDPAVQIRALDSEQTVGATQRAQVATALTKAGIDVLAIEDDSGSLLVRLADEYSQLTARSLIADTLNTNRVDFVVDPTYIPGRNSTCSTCVSDL